MRAATIARTIGAGFTLVSLIVIGMTGCVSSSDSRQTSEVTVTPQATTVTATVTPTAPATATATFAPLAAGPPPGVWCPVKQGQMPLVSACEIYPSPPRLSQAQPGLAGTQVGPLVGHGPASEATEYMKDPWAADVVCATNDESTTGIAQILMVAHTRDGDYYSWGNESCGPPSAPAYGHEFFREASVSVTLSIKPLTSNLSAWFAMLYQL
jgi:hypothetical protein